MTIATRPAPAPALELPRRVEALERCVADLQRQIARLEAAGERTTGAKGAALIREIARVVPLGVVFTTAELLEHATVHRSLATAIATRNARRLGLRLRGAAGVPMDGIVLGAIGDDNRGILWALHASS